MRLCRYDDDKLGLVDNGKVRDVSAALAVIPPARYPFPHGDQLIANLDAVKAAIAGLADDGARKALREVKLLSPVANPGKLVAAPVNYKAHVEEAAADVATFTANHILKIHEAGFFLKGTSSLIGVGQPIEIIHPARRTDHEIELAVIIGKPGRRIAAKDALSHVAGYAIGLDITIRGPEERSLRKSLDTYSVLGPWIVTADEVGDPAGLDLALDVDGQSRQRANTRDLIIDVPGLIEFASSYYTLHPGDVLYTGTPEGVGPIRPGERVTASITRVGDIQVDVVAG